MKLSAAHREDAEKLLLGFQAWCMRSDAGVVSAVTRKPFVMDDDDDGFDSIGLGGDGDNGNDNGDGDSNGNDKDNGNATTIANVDNRNDDNFSGNDDSYYYPATADVHQQQTSKTSVYDLDFDLPMDIDFDDDFDIDLPKTIHTPQPTTHTPSRKANNASDISAFRDFSHSNSTHYSSSQQRHVPSQSANLPWLQRQGTSQMCPICSVVFDPAQRAGEVRQHIQACLSNIELNDDDMAI